jgi:hypothetical protein
MCRTALRLLYIVKCMRVFGRPLGYFKVFVFAFKYHQHWMYTYLAHESSKLQRSFNSTSLSHAQTCHLVLRHRVRLPSGIMKGGIRSESPVKLSIGLLSQQTGPGRRRVATLPFVLPFVVWPGQSCLSFGYAVKERGPIVRKQRRTGRRPPGDGASFVHVCTLSRRRRPWT